MKVKCDHRSKFSNLSNWKEEAWKKSGLVDNVKWPPKKFLNSFRVLDLGQSECYDGGK